MEQIRAPLYEDKVVDLIIERINVTDVPVSKDTLQTESDELETEGQPEAATEGAETEAEKKETPTES